MIVQKCIVWKDYAQMFVIIYFLDFCAVEHVFIPNQKKWWYQRTSNISYV
jgi:hypothetical protein